MKASLALPAACLLLCACDGLGDGDSAGPADVATFGDADQGATLIALYECGACHTIPGISAAEGTVGPPLDMWSERSYIAGNIPNVPENLVHWLMDPHAVEPGTAMPDLGLTEQEARDVAAYLYTLE